MNNDTAEKNSSHLILEPAVKRILAETNSKRIFDLGCGNGSVASELSEKYSVVGIDASSSAVAMANRAYPTSKSRLGRRMMTCPLNMVRSTPFLASRSWNTSTPYHGYVKNLVLAVTGKMDNHFWALWDGGHIKFWSIKTLGMLLEEVGLDIVRSIEWAEFRHWQRV
ncbi:class I SAM-dependent methyltransferase [Mesorhizobium sp. M0854]